MYLEINGLKKSYGKDTSYVEVLRGVSASVGRGQMCAIQGASGSGKSTLLNCIGGLETIDSGSVKVDGREISGLKPKELSEYRRALFSSFIILYRILPCRKI